MTNSIEMFLSIAITIDREELRRQIAILDSPLGETAMKMMISGSDNPLAKQAVTGGQAMLKLTAFYLDELHKLFP